VGHGAGNEGSHDHGHDQLEWRIHTGLIHKVYRQDFSFSCVRECKNFDVQDIA